jgi:release factor glutamine methyltransferase
MNYVQMDTWSIRKNEPKRSQNEPKVKMGKMNATYYITKGYAKTGNTCPKKTNPKQTQIKPKQTQSQTKCTPCGFFLFFTFLYPGYNLPMQTWTIQRLLNWMTDYYTKNGIDAPRLNAELLLSHVLKMERIELYTHFDKIVTNEQLDILHDLVKRAGQHEPIGYLTGKTEFYSLQLEVSPDCMIPRPETELLVERAIEFLRTRTGPQFVCDLCTGGGCIAVAIAKNSPQAKIIATDICDAALNVAAKNIEKHDLQDRIKLLHGDLFEPVVPQLDVEKPVRHSQGGGGFDLIVCNPPYVSVSEFEKLDKCVKDYEPRLALFAGVDGLDVYRRIIDKADRFLRPDGALILEIGYAQGSAIKDLLEKSGAFAEIKIEKDFNGNDRIATALKQLPQPGL